MGITGGAGTQYNFRGTQGNSSRSANPSSTWRGLLVYRDSALRNRSPVTKPGGAVVLVRVDWRDGKGRKLADAATLHEIPKVLEEIRQQDGKLVFVQLLEKRCEESR